MAATSLQPSRTTGLSHTSVEECSAYHRKSNVEYFTDDTRLEDEFFRRRTLSLCDFDGSRSIQSPTKVQERVSSPGHHGSQADVTPLTPCSANPSATMSRYYDWNYGSTPAKVTLADEVGEMLWFADAESIQDDHNCMLPEPLEGLKEPRCTIDPGLQIGVAGPLKVPLVTGDDIPERALAPSIWGEICNASTPDLTQDESDEEELNVVAPGFDASPASLHFFSQAGVHVTTRNLQDDFAAAQTTNLAGGCLDIDQASQIEKDRITSEFFGMFESETASTELEAASPTGTVRVHSKRKNQVTAQNEQYLFPAVYDDLADGDYYLGRDAKTPRDPYFDPSSSTSSGCSPSANENMLPAPLKFPLVRSAKPQHDEFSTHAFEEPDTAAAIRGIPLNQLFVPGNEQLIRHTTTRSKVQSPKLTVAEAPFRNSALMQRRNKKVDLIRKRKAEDHEKEFISSKRSCLTFLKKHSSQIKAHASYLSELRLTASNQASSKTSSKSSLGTHLLLTSPMPQALKGFKGQFEMHMPDQMSCLKTCTTRHVFGSRSHPNGMITNTRFTPDSRHATFDLTEYDINHDAALLAITAHGEQQSTRSAGLHVLRTPAENELRKEAHRECTSARLEGVCVGYYRYFLGHMTVEEYVEAGMCVCWDRCFCNKFCTRFGDLRCPCTAHLVMDEEEGY